MFKEAKKLGDKLIVIINNDKQRALKGSKEFMKEDERKFIVESIIGVNQAVIAIDDDKTVCQTLTMIKPDIFANGGDRKNQDEIPESRVCQEQGIKMIFNVGGEKIQSSSWLLKKDQNQEKQINFQEKKVIIADVDETICETCQQISEEMAQQISNMIQQGYRFAFISGTKCEDLKNMISSRIKKEHHLLGTTGTRYIVINEESAQTIYNYSLSTEEKQEIMIALNKVIDHFQIQSMTSKEDQLQDRDSQITLSAIGRNAPLELKKAYDPNGEKRQIWIKYLKQHLDKNKYDFKIGGTTSLDITHKGLDKEWGIRKFAEHHSIPLNQILFFGDNIYPGGNDFPATKVVDCISVRNPEDTLQELKNLQHLNQIILEQRPWGKFEQFVNNEKSTVKILDVEAGKRLSLQSHQNRDELWVALDEVEVEVNGLKKNLSRGEKIFIPKNSQHRLSSNKGGRILEISFGDFKEEDIIRYEDDFGRK